MNKTKKTIFLLLIIILLVPVIASSATDDAVTDTIKAILKWVRDISLALAVLMYTVGGFLWMSDAGSAERSKMAKSIIVSTTIGLIIVLMAEAIYGIVSNFTE